MRQKALINVSTKKNLKLMSTPEFGVPDGVSCLGHKE